MSDVVIALSILFITGGVFVLLANRVGLPVVPALIVSGIVAGQFIDEEPLLDLAIWGIAFLVFVFGIRIDFGDVQMVLRDAEIAALTQLIVVAPVAFVVGFLASSYFGFNEPVRNGVYFAAAAALSSTLVGASSLRGDEIRENLVHGRLASAIHFFDDMIAIAILLVLSAPVIADVDMVMTQLGYGLVFVVAGLLIYQHGYPLLIRVADGGSELVLMGSISILIGFIAAAEWAGISLVVGAFAAGLAIRKEGVETLAVRNGIASIRDFFVAIFFITMGALVTTPDVETLVFAGALIGLTLLVNPLIQIAAFSLEGYDPRTAFLASFSLNQVSELAIVIAIQALILTTIAEQLFNAIILAAVITMVLAAGTRRHEEWLYEKVAGKLVDRRRWHHLEAHSSVPDSLAGHVVVIGYGRIGRRITAALNRLGVEYVVIENDPVLFRSLAADCRHYVFGDATGRHPREMAGYEDASLIISTCDYGPLSNVLVETPTDGELILRSRSSINATEYLDRGADYVIVPNLLAGEQLTEIITAVVNNSTDVGLLKGQHLRELRELQRSGMTSQFD